MSAETVEKPATDAPPAPLRILLVDDQALTARMLKRQLSGATDLVLRTTQDPLQAVALAEEWQPVVVLLDLVMPKLSGLDGL